ncbi:MAG: right-handed parallel beta-helix repeat-containing protein [Candidatus Woesearchaeota archaeon]
MEKSRLNYKIFSHTAASNHGLYILIALVLFTLFSASYVLAIVNLVAPADSVSLNTNNDTLAFTFNYTNELTGTVDCNLTLNTFVVGSQASVVVDTLSAIYSSAAFLEGVNPWDIICSNTTDTNVSSTRSFTFDSNAPTAGPTTAMLSPYVYSTWLACSIGALNISASFNDTNSGINTSSCEWQDRSQYPSGSWRNDVTVWEGNSTHGYCISTGGTSTVEQDYNLRVRARDNAGNLATAATYAGNTDCTAPTTSNNETSGWHSASYTVELTCSDPKSGCANISYNYNSGGWVTGGPGPIEVTIDALGNNTLEYYSTDNVSNTESTNTVYAALSLQCGDVITSDTTLPSDLTGCTGTGITIGTAGVTLDCNGHYIQGDYVSSGNEYGVYITANGVTVKNCTIYGYNTSSGVEAGIYATGSNNVLLQDNIFYNNYYGAWLVGGSGSNITGSNVYGAMFKGIFVDTGTSSFRVTGSNIHDTYSSAGSNAAGISVYASGMGTVFGNILTNMTGASSGIISGIHILDAGNMNISGNTISSLNTTGISVNDPGVGANGFTVADNSVTNCTNGIGVAGANHNITRNTIANNTGTGLSIDENTVHVWHNNIYGNSDSQIYINPMATIELSLGSQGNYWGHSSCPLFLTSDVKNGYTTVTDSYAYNATDGWSTYGTPPTCSRPNVTLVMPGVSGVRMFNSFNFSVNVTDIQPVLGVSISNGTAAQSMAMSGADPTNAVWWAVVYLSGLSDGAQSLSINATNSYMYNDTEGFDVVVDNTAPSVTPSSPVNNFNTSIGSFNAVFTVADDLATNMSCNATLYNASGNPVSTLGNDTTINNTATTLLLSFAAPGVYTWNVTCYDKAGSNVLTMVNGNAGSSATRTVTYDLTPPIPTSINISEPDNLVSGVFPNENITLILESSDVGGTGVMYVEANFSEVTGDLADMVNMTPNGTHWVVVFETDTSDTSDMEFDPFNVTTRVVDYAGNVNDAAFYTVVLYNMTLLSGDPEGCGNIVAGSTNFALEDDWNDIDIILLIDMNFSLACDIPAMAVDNQSHRVAKFNFTGMDMNSEAAFQQLGQFMESVDVEITPEGQFGNSRISLNSSALVDFNTTSVITMYGLPFDSMPTVLGDYGTADNGTSISYVKYVDTDTGYILGNLTFTVQGFSGYNVSDTANPSITVNAPAPNMTTVGGSTPLVNFTVNGTGTQVSWVQVYLDGTGYSYNPADSRYEVTCNASSLGSELYYCNLTSSLDDGAHTLNITAFDYGGDAGNSNNTVWIFTTDSSRPSVTNNQTNSSGTIRSTDSVLLNVTATDSTNVSNVTAGGVLMSNHTASGYNLSSTPAALGCGQGWCTVYFNATDYFGNYNDSVTVSMFVDDAGPVVTSVSVTNATNVTSAVAVNIQATVTDVSGVGSVVATNGNMMYLLSGNIYHANLTAGDLGCASNTICTITINASDTLGNYNDTETTSYYVDDTNPAVTSPSRSPAEVKSASALYLGTVVADVSNVTSVVSNNSVALTKGASSWNVTTSAGALGCAANAVCNIGFTATDMAGNVNNSVTTTVAVDDTVPVATFVYNSTNLIKSGDSVTLNITVNESNTVASVQVNSQDMDDNGGGKYGITTTGTTLGCTSTGTCTVTFVANDTAGNSGTTSTSVTVDNAGPVVSGASVTNTTSGKQKIGTVVNIAATVTDSPAGVASVTVNSTPMYLMGGTWQANVTGTALSCAANSLCTLLFTATDTLGNVNNTVTTSYTTDNTAPTNLSAFSASGTTSSTVSATMNEAAKFTVNYGTNESMLNSSANSSSFATALAVSFSTSASTVYYYNITDCWDELGNSQNLNEGPFNFTTSTAPTGGGGGGGSVTVTSEITIGDLTGSSTEMEMRKGDVLKFRHNAEDHQVKVKALGSSYADIEVMSEPQLFRLFIGQSNDVDVDGDAKNDLTVKLLDIAYNKALVKVTSLVTKEAKIALLPPAKRTPKVVEEPVVEQVTQVTEEAAPVQPEPVAEPAPAPVPVEPVVDSQQGMQWYWYAFSGVIVLILVSLVGLYVFEKKRIKGI